MQPQRNSTALALSPKAELVQIEADIKAWMPECRRGFVNFLGYRFLIGRALLRAKEIVPHNAGGDRHSVKFKEADADEEPAGFLAWKRAAFPGIANSTLSDHKAFAERAIKLHPDLETVDLHELPASQVETVFEKLRDCTSGKDVTLSTRAMGLLQEALPAGGFRPNTGELETWLKKNHPELAGSRWLDLPAKVRKAYQEAVAKREAARYSKKNTTPEQLLAQRQWEAEQEVSTVLPRLVKWAKEKTLLALADIQTTLDFLAPPVPVGRRFEYKVHDNAEFLLADGDDVRAIGSQFKPVEYQRSTVNAKTDNRGLTIKVDHDEAVFDNWQQVYTGMLMARLKRNQLIRVINLALAAATNNPVTWYTNGTAADPDSDLENAIIASGNACGVEANRCLFGRTGFFQRKKSYKAQNVYGGGFVAAVETPEELAGSLGLDGLQVCKHRFQSSATAKSLVLALYALIFNAQDAITPMDPSHLKRFYSPCEGSTPVRVFLKEHMKFTEISVEHYDLSAVTQSTGLELVTIATS